MLSKQMDGGEVVQKGLMSVLLVSPLEAVLSKFKLRKLQTSYSLFKAYRGGVFDPQKMDLGSGKCSDPLLN